MHPAQMARDGVEIVDPPVAGQCRRKRACQLVRKLAIAATDQCSCPAIVGVAHPAEAVHRDHDVDAGDECRQRVRGAGVVPMRGNVPVQIVGLHHPVERCARGPSRGLRDLRRSLFEPAVQRTKAERRSGDHALFNARGCKQLGEHRTRT